MEDPTMPLTMHDISVPDHPGMLHYGRKPEKTMVESIANGDPGNVSRWLIGSHTGTHVDAPAHIVEGATTIEDVPLETLVGPAVVLDLTSVASSEIGPDDLIAAGLDDTERVLLKTPNSAGALREAEKSPWVGLSEAAAELLVERGVRLVGIDYLTIDAPAGEVGWPVHHVLCGAGVAILEVIDLSDIAPGRYTLAALPIKLVGSEAAPARTVLLEGWGA
jgi:arylformamidase